jgi:ParB-like chromosome segregation protein Spo0J
MNEIREATERLCELVMGLDLDDQVSALNEIRLSLHRSGPFADEPVDLVQWVKNGDVHANDYNPNSVAPPEMELLRLSIANDGYTQPIVTFPHDGKIEVVDGFHRNRVGKECADIQERVKGYLPTVKIRPSQEGVNDRMASTVRHNRARGKHSVDGMSEIVVDLKKRNWSEKKIGKELGMDPDEVLRLCQISGLAEMFSDQEFSEAWEAAGVDWDGNTDGIEFEDGESLD